MEWQTTLNDASSSPASFRIYALQTLKVKFRLPVRQLAQYKKAFCSTAQNNIATSDDTPFLLSPGRGISGTMRTVAERTPPCRKWMTTACRTAQPHWLYTITIGASKSIGNPKRQYLCHNACHQDQSPSYSSDLRTSLWADVHQTATHGEDNSRKRPNLVQPQPDPTSRVTPHPKTKAYHPHY